MAYAKTTWKNRVVQNPQTYQQQQNADGSVTLIPKEGTVTEAGTPVNAVNMNHIEDGISSIDAANSIYSVGGTANAITVTTANGDYSYAQFKKLSIKAASDNTGNVTINVDGKGAVSVLKYDKSQLPAGAIKAGKVYDFYYDTANICFFLIAKASGNAVAADVLAGKTFSNDSDSGLIGTATIVKLVAGDKYSLYSNTTSHYTTQYDTTVFIDKITIQFDCNIRISFNLSSGANGTHVQGQIYKNRQPIGVARDVNSNSPYTFSEDFECKNGDVFELCLVAPSKYDRAYSTYFEVLCDISSNPILSS